MEVRLVSEVVLQRCPTCKVEKGVEGFHAFAWGKVGTACRPCYNETRRLQKYGSGVRTRRSFLLEENKKLFDLGLRRCSKCDVVKGFDDFFLGRNGKPRAACKP